MLIDELAKAYYVVNSMKDELERVCKEMQYIQSQIRHIYFMRREREKKGYDEEEYQSLFKSCDQYEEYKKLKDRCDNLKTALDKVMNHHDAIIKELIKE